MLKKISRPNRKKIYYCLISLFAIGASIVSFTAHQFGYGIVFTIIGCIFLLIYVRIRSNEKKSVTFRQVGIVKSRKIYDDDHVNSVLQKQKESEIHDRIKSLHKIHHKDIFGLEFDYGECSNCGSFWYDGDQKICGTCGVELK